MDFQRIKINADNFSFRQEEIWACMKEKPKKNLTMWAAGSGEGTFLITLNICTQNQPYGDKP